MPKRQRPGWPAPGPPAPNPRPPPPLLAPRPRPEPVCGLIRDSRSPTELAPSAATSPSLKVAIGASAVSTYPRIRSATTTISRASSSDVTRRGKPSAGSVGGDSTADRPVGAPGMPMAFCAKASAADKSRGKLRIKRIDGFSLTTDKGRNYSHVSRLAQALTLQCNIDKQRTVSNCQTGHRDRPTPPHLTCARRWPFAARAAMGAAMNASTNGI